MFDNVIVNIRFSHKSISFALVLFVLSGLFVFPATAQNKPSENDSIVPFAELLKKPVAIRPKLNNVHPRLFFTKEDLPKMRGRASSADKELWQAVLIDLQTLTRDAPDPSD